MADIFLKYKFDKQASKKYYFTIQMHFSYQKRLMRQIDCRLVKHSIWESFYLDNYTR